MKLEHYSEEKLKKQVNEIVGKYLSLEDYDVFFFGSRVKGDSTSRSDIDIGIRGPKEVPGDIKLDIKEELNKLPLLYKFDVVDFKELSESFKKHTLNNVEHVG